MSDGPQTDPEIPHARPRVRKLRLLAILSGLLLIATVSTVFGMMMAVAADLPRLENREEFRSARNSVLLDVRGRPLGILTANNNRILVRESEISPAMKHAIIAIEDRRFYENPGVDVRGIARAFVQDILAQGAVQGGSTITQQFVKNALDAQQRRTVFQKLREAALAYHLTRKWSKQKILTEYLNAIYFGNGAYGIEAAARTYFAWAHPGCEETRCAPLLEPHEAALLAGVVASPTAYDPVEHNLAARQRRDVVLRNMRDQGYITDAEYRRGSQYGVPGPDQVVPPREKSEAPYFTTWVRQQVVDHFGAARAFQGGLKVRTTIDLEMQEQAEGAIRQFLGGPGMPAAALVAIDNKTGEVRAMVGGSNYQERPFNLATQGQRQPGSAFKPFVLAAALQRGITADSAWTSKKLEIPVRGSKETFVVNNYEDSYSGITSLARATTFSDNAVYAQVGLKTGLRRVARLARRMGIRTPVSTNYAMTLGGLKEGVTPLDIAHAYQTFAAGGERVWGSLGAPEEGPVGIREVCEAGTAEAAGPCGSRDKRIVRNRVRKDRVLPRGVSDQVTQILQTVVTSGTARRAATGGFAAGKTGTTEDYGDAWFVGWNERLTVAVWVGHPDTLKPMETEYHGQPVAGGTFPADIWRAFMLAADRIYDQRAADRARRLGKDLPEEDTPAPAPAPTETAPQEPTETAPDEQDAPEGGRQEPPPQPPAEQKPERQAPPPQPAPAPEPAPEEESPGGGTPPPGAGR